MIKINILILGYGQIGSSIGNIIKKKHKLYIVDPKYCKSIKIPENGFDIMHICIPYTNNFITDVSRQIHTYKPKCVIIEATVIPGTTREIYKQTNINIAHSPVVGVHPQLTKSLKIFTKFVGPINKETEKIVEKYYNGIGIQTEIFNSPMETELAKILSTTTYGIHIAWITNIYNICTKFNIDFNNVYRRWTQNYNRGYKKLKMGHVKRPILNPCLDGFGGHCVHENAILLYKYLLQFDIADKFTNEILKIGKNDGKEKNRI